ncbi:MAG: phosphatidate cytidylyltransferase [Actinomycetota bacterium]
MSDDIWRRRDDTTEGGGTDYGTDFGSDFGTIQFADDPTSEPAIVFADTDSTGLPHWTEPPTGEIPRAGNVEDEDDTDVWASFQQPSQPTRRPERLVIGGDSTGDRGRPRDVTGDTGRDPSRDVPRDTTGGTSRPVARGPQVRRGTTRGPRGAAGRDMPTAVTTGLILLAVFIGAVMWRPAAVMLIVVAVLGLASVEFFSKVTEKGYRPATFAGLISCVAAPLAAYWMGDAALPLVVAFGFLATSVGFLGAAGVQSGPMPNVAITNMAVTWIGLLGSFAALILRQSVSGSPGNNIGTDTVFILVAAVVANDVGALFVGSAAGRTPLREWVSPNKSVEGLLGGAVATIIACALVGSQNGTWNDMGEWLALAVVVSIMAPLGDLVESMFKRNLDVKDFGTLVAGHGGVLDRFDGFLFALPAAYYLLQVLQPWTS